MHSHCGIMGVATEVQGGSATGSGKPVLRGASLVERFDELTRFLGEHREVFGARPYASLPVSWEPRYPDVAQWFRGLDDDRIDREEASPGPFDDAPPDLHGFAHTAARLAGVGGSVGRESAVPSGTWRVPGRKRAQIAAFVAAALDPPPPPWLAAIVDWCAGKGHLGRAIAARSGAPVLGVELRGDLCREAATLAAEAQANYTPIAADVLNPASMRATLRPDHGVVALHACGHLHRALYRHAAAHGIPWLAVAPCCPQRLGGARAFEPCSARGRRAGLRLVSHDLHLSYAQEILAGPAKRAHRRREIAYRLGLDRLAREASGVDVHHSAGSVPRRLFRAPFAVFAREAAARSGLVLPARFDEEEVLHWARERLRVVRALGLVRMIFARPLELWLVLDGALSLAEAGFDVEVRRFCPPEITPRNLVVLARRLPRPS